MKNLHIRARKRRLELRLSQEEVANRMGLAHRVSVYNIEKGRPITQKVIVRLAKALETTPSYLMGWETDSKPSVPKRYTDHLEKWNDEFGYEEFSEDELNELIKYAKFLIMQREENC